MCVCAHVCSTFEIKVSWHFNVSIVPAVMCLSLPQLAFISVVLLHYWHCHGFRWTHHWQSQWSVGSQALRRVVLHWLEAPVRIAAMAECS